MDDSAWEVTLAMAMAADLRVTEVRAGPIQILRNRLQSIWVQCPKLAGVHKIAEAGRLRIGWRS